MQQSTYPVRFRVNYPDRTLDRVTTFFRIIVVIPISIVFGVVAGGTWQLALMNDRYPSTDEHQSVHLEYEYPDVRHDLNCWLPLGKGILAIPHDIVLFFLGIAAIVATVVVWFAILFTGPYPRALFDFVESVTRWQNRVVGYAVVLVTDQYPPFRLAP